MAPPDLPQPDDVPADLAKAIWGPDHWLVYVVVFVTFLIAWYGFAKWASRHTRAAIQKAVSIPPAARASAVVLTLIAVAGQVFYIVVSYCIATFVPYVAEHMGERASAAPVDVVSWMSGLPKAPTDKGLFWVWLIVALGVAAIGWTRAVVGTSPLDLIALFFLACGVVAAVVFFLLGGEIEIKADKGEVSPEEVVRMRAFAWLSLIYTALAVVAVYVPKACVNVWNSAGRSDSKSYIQG